MIDSNGMAYRTVYNLDTLHSGGNKTGVIFGFLSQLLSIAEKFGTNQFIFIWDSRQSFRKMDYPGYKKRDHDPEKQELIEQAHTQFDLLRKEILPAMGFKNVFMQSGYEADDLIAWVVARQPDEYTIVTGDDDLLQLLWDDKYCPVQIYNLSKKKIITADYFTNKYGLRPIDWIEVKAIGGCTSDKVKGIPGVGPESAIKYLHKSLKDGSIKNKIESEEGKRLKEECRNLVALPYNGDRPIVVPEIIEDELWSLDFIDMFKKWGCNSFVSPENFDRWRKAFNLQTGRK
jgi:DNA polymerase-1